MKKIIVMVIGCVFFFGFYPKGFAYSNQEFGWGTTPVRDEIAPDAGPAYNNLLKKYEGVYLGDKTKKIVYLTFDNGYEHNNHTTLILNTLKEKKVPATFFITGHFIKSNPDLVKRMVAEGHIVGNHTYHHPALTTIDDTKLRAELKQLKDAYTQVTGKTEMKYVRPPEGRFSERTLGVCLEEGYHHVFWSLAFMDWNVNGQRGWQYSHDSVVQKIHPGAIILLHSISKDNVDALDKIINTLRLKGYEFASLDQLFQNLPKAQTSQ